MTLKPEFVGLDLGRQYWGGLNTPRYAGLGWIPSVDEKGDLTYSSTKLGDLTVFPAYYDQRYYAGTVATPNVTIPDWLDLEYSELRVYKYSIVIYDPVGPSLQYYRQGNMRKKSINTALDSDVTVDLSAGKYATTLPFSVSRILYTINQGPSDEAYITTRIWTHVRIEV